MIGSGVLIEVSHAAHLAFRDFVPRVEDREPLTWRTLPQAFLYMVPYFFMAFLVRRRDTHFMRMLLLPTVIGMAIRCTFRYKSGDPRMTWFEWDRGLMALFAIAKSIDFAFTTDGRRKVGEGNLPRIYEPDYTAPTREGSSAQKNTSLTCRGLVALGLPRGVADALDVGVVMRGVGWDFGQHLRIPTETRPLEHRLFAWIVLKETVLCTLCLDAWDTLEKLAVTSAGCAGDTIFLPHLPRIQRYMVSTALHVGHGLFIFASVANLYNIFTLFGILVLGHSPKEWPPIVGDLRRVRSLHDFWSREWHQALRYTFFTFGGFPGRSLAGSTGMVLGTFLASGLIHEVGLSAAGVGLDHRVTVFFLLQALGLMLERAHRKLTGRRVGGLLGLAWATLFVVGFGQMCTEAWFARGIGMAITIPESLSVTRIFIVPLVRKMVSFLASSIDLGFNRSSS